MLDIFLSYDNIVKLIIIFCSVLFDVYDVDADGYISNGELFYVCVVTFFFK